MTRQSADQGIMCTQGLQNRAGHFLLNALQAGITATQLSAPAQIETLHQVGPQASEFQGFQPQFHQPNMGRLGSQ